MGVKLVSSSGGSVEINPPTTASNFTATMPAGTGTVAVQGVSGVLVSGTAQASTSGTSIDFTSIPSWVKRITVMFQGVSTNGSSVLRVQLGTSGGVATSGYLGSAATTSASSAATTNFTAGFDENASGGSAAASIRHGAYSIQTLGSNAWTCSALIGFSNETRLNTIAGSVTLSGTLDRVRITTANGTDTFDAGSINILYE